jgi:hypothetical protein
MRQVAFTYNWNNKLHNKSFTSLRLENNEKYVIGETYEILEKGIIIKKATIEGIRSIYIHEINLFIARLDTGYNIEGCVKIIKTMYSKKNIDWTKQKISFLLFVTAEEKKA